MCKLKWRRNIVLAVLLLLAMLMQMAVPLAAAETTIPTGDYTIGSDGIYRLDSGYSGVLSVADSVYQATIIGDSSTTFNATRIEIGSRDSDLELVIQDLKINATGQGIYLNTAAKDVDVYLYINGECSVQATGAAISTPGGTNLIIDSYSGDDHNDILTATAVSAGFNAGIGGADGGFVGNITIAGGTVTAKGGNYGAGIGRGYMGKEGTITICGGRVTATGGYAGAGIGGGYESSGCTVTISNNPTIIATGYTYANMAEHIGHGWKSGNSGTLKDSSGNDLSYLRFKVVDMGGIGINGAMVNVDGNDYLTNDSGLTGCVVLLDGSTAKDYSVGKPGYISKTDSVVPSAMNVEVPVTLEAVVETDLAIDVAYAGSYTVGENGIYTVTVTNNGSAASSSDITVSDTIPVGFTVDTYAGSGWTFDMAGDILTATYSSSLAAGASSSFTVTGTVTGGAGSTVSNTATVSTGDTDPNLSNNSDTEEFTIQAIDAAIAPNTAAFDKYRGSANYRDIVVTKTLNGNTLSGIKNGGTDLTEVTDYTVSGSTVAINKSYLAQQATGTTTLTFDFSSGADPTLVITISDSTPSSSGGDDGSSSWVVNSTTGSAQVFPSHGGKISLGDEVTVDLPQGALQGNARVPVTIQKTDISQVLPSGFMLLGQAYEFQVGGENSYNFNKPVTLTFTFDPDKVPPGETPAIHYYDPVTLQWVKLGGTISGNTITIEIDHFTIFAVLAERSGTGTTSQTERTSFSDINGHWAEKTIKELTAQVSIGGYPDGTFRPDQPITRAEFVSVLIKALNLQSADSGKAFSDIVNHWAEGSINIAVANGIIGGYDDNTFRPDEPITREQMAAILVNAAKLKASPEETSFTDNGDISLWARGSAAAAVNHGLMSGYPDNTFKPLGQATRAEVMTVILKLTK